MVAPDPCAPAVVLAVGSRLTTADVPLLWLRLRLLLRQRDGRAGRSGERVVCDVSALEAWDLATVDALARLSLLARRLDCRLWLMGAPVDLPGLLEAVGLDEAIPCCPRSVLERGREPEHREEARGVEEERDPGDPTA